jgi:hypothetical protein
MKEKHMQSERGIIVVVRLFGALFLYTALAEVTLLIDRLALVASLMAQHRNAGAYVVQVQTQIVRIVFTATIGTSQWAGYRWWIRLLTKGIKTSKAD